MEENFKLEIISPEKILYSKDARMVTLPSYEGDMSILKNHISIITFLRPGIIKVAGNKDAQYFVEEGTGEFTENNLAILSSTIIEISALSKEKISKMIEECRNQLSKENIDDKKYYVVSHKADCLSKINL